MVWRQLPRPDWFRFYLDDLLCLPIILTIVLFAMRFFYGPQIRFSLFHVVFVVLYVALAFEVIFPQFMPRYSADVVDVGLYAVGGWIFYRFLNT